MVDDLPKVLIVDDHPGNLLALEAALDGLPCELVRAASGEDALRYLLVADVALLLLDVRMPGLDGYETARHIRQRERTSHIPVIFLSAIDRDLEHQLRGYAAGGVDFVAKPFEPAALVMKVRVFLDLFRQARNVEASSELLAARLEGIRAAHAELEARAAALGRANVELASFAAAATKAMLEPAHLASGFFDLFGAETAGLTDRQRLLLERATAALGRVTSTAEELSRHAQGGIGIEELVPVDLGDVLARALDELSEAIASSGARITADPLPAVLGASWHLQRVFVEILANALRYCGGEPDIHLGVGRRGSRFVVTVHDDGPGIDEAVLPRLFQPFADLTAGNGRCGVGLAFCRRAVGALGGAIWASSSPGRGTDISFSLRAARAPLPVSEPPPAPAPPLPAPAPDGGPGGDGSLP